MYDCSSPPRYLWYSFYLQSYIFFAQAKAAVMCHENDLSIEAAAAGYASRFHCSSVLMMIVAIICC